jgi:hypothetical protein
MLTAEDRVRAILYDYNLSTDRSGLVEALVMAVRLSDEQRENDGDPRRGTDRRPFPLRRYVR